MIEFDFYKILYLILGKYIKIKDFGENNTVNSNSASQINILGSGCIIFKGNNNKINVGKYSQLKNFKIEFWGDNITLTIGENCVLKDVYAVFSGSKNYNIKSRIVIGDNFSNTGCLQIFAGGNDNCGLEIGKNCLFSRDIVIYAHDGHNIYDKDSNKIINESKHPIKIGDKVWVGHGAKILKNTTIPNDSIIGAGSVVSGNFIKENTIIAGNPAKVIKENIYWEK